jgi:hypothetical protein
MSLPIASCGVLPLSHIGCWSFKKDGLEIEISVLTLEAMNVHMDGLRVHGSGD